jgi:membrane protein implicated in regulation of membrane protease activity
MEMTFWLIVFVALLVIEIATMGLTTIWFAGGALVSFLAAYIGFGVGVQVAVFLIVSILLLVLTRPIAVKFFNQERQKTNADSLIGQKAVVKEAIDIIQATGRVEVNGMEWSAKTEEPGVIEADTIVVIKGIQGVKLIVEKEEV